MITPVSQAQTRSQFLLLQKFAFLLGIYYHAVAMKNRLKRPQKADLGQGFAEVTAGKSRRGCVNPGFTGALCSGCQQVKG